MEIKQMLIPVSNTKARPGIKRTPTNITIHETGNNKKGANALTHARLQARGNDRTASWHYQVDDESIYQSVPDDEVAWAAGDGRGEGNMKGIQIEICVNSDGNFSKAVANAAWLVRHLMAKHGIKVESVVQHNKWSGKNCPQIMHSGKGPVTWGVFIGMLSDSAVPKKEDDELKFSSPTLKSETETSLLSKAHRQIIVDAAVKAGAHTSWADKLANNTLTDADVLGLAVKYTVAVNK